MINLKTRERKIIAACVALLLIAVIHIALVSPGLKKRAGLHRSIEETRDELKKMRLLELEYNQMLEESKEIKRSMSGQRRNFKLSGSFLEQIAIRLNIRDNLKSVKSDHRNIDNNLGEDMVEVKLEGISLENLVGYVYEIERTGTTGAATIAIPSIRITPESKLGGGLEVTMLVTAIGPP